METRDLISVIALRVSLVSLGLTLAQRYVEMRRSVRTQITTLMTEIARTLVSAQDDPSSGHRLVIFTRQQEFRSPSLWAFLCCSVSIRIRIKRRSTETCQEVPLRYQTYDSSKCSLLSSYCTVRP